MNLTGMICAGMSLVGNEKVAGMSLPGMSFLRLKNTGDKFSGMSLPGMNRRECAITATMTRTHGVLRMMRDLKNDHTSLQNTITSGRRPRVMVLEGHVVILGYKSCVIPHK